jgi:hypothetical protein
MKVDDKIKKLEKEVIKLKKKQLPFHVGGVYNITRETVNYGVAGRQGIRGFMRGRYLLYCSGYKSDNELWSLIDECGHLWCKHLLSTPEMIRLLIQVNAEYIGQLKDFELKKEEEK